MPPGINAAGPRGAKGQVYPKNKGSLYPNQLVGSTLNKYKAASTLNTPFLWSDFTRDATTPLNGTFPYYSDGVVGESYGSGHYKATNGRLYKVSTSGAGTPLAWYPAPGFRDYGRGGAEGAARYVGNYGYSWSSATNGIYGQYLVFSVTSLSSSNALNRAFGFQLRCLSE